MTRKARGLRAAAVMRCKREVTLKGLVTTSLTPARRAASTAVALAWAETSTMGTWGLATRGSGRVAARRMVWAKTRPFMPGMFQSVTTRSGPKRRSRSMASPPSRADITWAAPPA